MGLDLNNIVVPYREFYGKNNVQMPFLISGRNKYGEKFDVPRVPLNTAGLLERRLYSGKQDWMNNYFDLGDGFAYHPDGRVKYVFDAQELRDISENSKLVNGALRLADGTFSGLKGVELTPKDIAKYADKDLSVKQAKSNKIWRIAARHPDEVPKEFAQDANLLGAYVDTVFSRFQETYAKDTKIEDLRLMGAYLDPTGDVEKMRAACVNGLGDRSQLNGGDWLDIVSGRLVGVAPEALNAQGATIARPTDAELLNTLAEKLGVK